MKAALWLRVQWDRIAALVFAVAGGVALIVGWVRLSGTPYPAEQLSFILSGGIAGMFLLGVGATVWLSADLRDEWRKLDVIDETLHQMGCEGTANSNPPAGQSPPEGQLPGGLVSTGTNS